MKGINVDLVEFRYLIGVKSDIGEASQIGKGLLYEIVKYLEDNNRMDGEFNLGECANWTTYRYNSTLKEDLDLLISQGYLEQIKKIRYKVIKHLWEK